MTADRNRDYAAGLVRELFTRAVLFAYKDWADMDGAERLRARYLHA